MLATLKRLPKNANFLLEVWTKLHNLPGGMAVFKQLLARVVPYSATINPEIIGFRPGYAKLRMRDRRGVRNHLNSIHAIALANLAELTSGLALNSNVPSGYRAILKSFSIDYLKKARGTIVAESTAPDWESIFDPANSEKFELTVDVEARNTEGECVTRARALWLIGREK